MIGHLTLLVIAVATTPAQATAQPATAAPTTVEEPKICRREVVTGSKARFRRICMTKAEWNNLWSRTRESNAQIDQQYGRGLCLNSAASGNC